MPAGAQPKSPASAASRCPSRPDGRLGTDADNSQLTIQNWRMSAYSDGVRMLARRELSVAQLRERLRDREHSSEDVEAAIARLLESGQLDDRRVAFAYARTAGKVKGRGRVRVQRELHAMGIARDVAADAIAQVFGDLDERALVEKAIQKKLRSTRVTPQRKLSLQERARLYQYLMRQGFTPGGISAALRRIGADPGGE